MKLLEGKVAIITGAASGIGRGTAVVFAEHGARLVLIDRDEAGLESLREQLAAQGGTDKPGRAGYESTHAMVGLVGR